MPTITVTKKDTQMSLPPSVDGETVIVGGGFTAATIAATLAACGKPPPIVIEKRKNTGGVFDDLAIFQMNSANGASIQSVASPGPTRIPSLSPSDDLNWIPNGDEQVRGMSGMVEYPYSKDMGKAIQRTLAKHARVYTGAQITFNRDGECYSTDGQRYLGFANRVIFAGGLVEKKVPEGPAIMSGYAFMKSPVRNLAGLRIALVGGGDTAAQCAEFMVGQGVGKPVTFPDRVDWYGGANMPTTKETWMRYVHTRWALIGHHLSERNGIPSDAVFRPYTQRGEAASLGQAAWVNGQVYDLAIMAIGFDPAPCPFSMPDVVRVGGEVVARYTVGYPSVYRVGTAADLGVSFKPYTSRFVIPAQQAIYNLGPRIAAFAASLP